RKATVKRRAPQEKAAAGAGAPEAAQPPRTATAARTAAGRVGARDLRDIAESCRAAPPRATPLRPSPPRLTPPGALPTLPPRPKARRKEMRDFLPAPDEHGHHDGPASPRPAPRRPPRPDPRAGRARE